jgi:transcriptional regulator GlxA family with amidase domain
MSLRQFSRTFRAQTGTTPARVVEGSAPIWPEVA